MPIVAMTVSDPYWELLRTGRKPIEIRKASPTWARIKEDDVLEITNAEDKSRSFRAGVSCVTRYPVAALAATAGASERAAAGREVLQRCLEAEGLAAALPDVKSMGEGVEKYSQFLGIEEVGTYGLLVIRVRPLAA